jgi:hypothetical protein
VTLELAPAETQAVEATLVPVPAKVESRSPLLAGVEFAWRSRRALLVVTLVQLLFGLTVALPLRARFATHLDAHPHAAALAGEPSAFDRAAGWEAGLDWSLLADVRRKEAPFLDALSIALVWLGVAAWLFGQAVAGGLLASAAEDEAALAGGAPPSAGAGTGPRGAVARFLAGAGRWFFPMLRTSLCFLVLAELVVRRLVFETWGGIAGDAESRATSDAVPWWGERQREIVYLVLFLAFRAGADLGRAHLVVKGRRSAVIAFGRGLWTLVRHPVRAGGLALLVAVPEMLLLAACAWLLARFPGGTPLHLVGAFVALQLAVYVRWSARAALLAGDVVVVRGTANVAASGTPPPPAAAPPPQALSSVEGPVPAPPKAPSHVEGPLSDAALG